MHSFSSGSRLVMATAAEPCITRFFRVLLPGFPQKLVLPEAFAQRLPKEKSITRAKLVNPNGMEWHVTVYEEKKRLYFGGASWTELIHAHDLGLGYFLVFSHEGNMVFSFQAFDLTTCEIAYPRLITNKAKEFEVTMTQHSLSNQYLYIPVGFLTECNLIAHRLIELTLQDPRGRSWPAHVGYRRKLDRHGPGAHIGAGWLQFARAHKLKLGDVCIFKLVMNEIEGEKIVMQVQIVRK